MSTTEAKRKMEEGRKRGCTFIDFNGGEPSLREDIVELVAYARQLDYETIAMTTNGRSLYYRDFAERLLAEGLNHIILSLHGHTPKLHNSLVQSQQAYQQALQGLKNVQELDPEVYVCTNTTIVQQNYQFLPQIAEKNIGLGVDALEFIFVHPRGNALTNFEQVVPHLEKIAPYIAQTIDVAEDNSDKQILMRYLPLCYLANRLSYSSEYQTKNKLREQHVGSDFKDLNVEKGRKEVGRVKAPFCSTCGLNGICEGIFKEYAERRGFSELNPLAVEHKQEG